MEKTGSAGSRSLISRDDTVEPDFVLPPQAPQRQSPSRKRMAPRATRPQSFTDYKLASIIAVGNCLSSTSKRQRTRSSAPNRQLTRPGPGSLDSYGWLDSLLQPISQVHPPTHPENAPLSLSSIAIQGPDHLASVTAGASDEGLTSALLVLDHGVTVCPLCDRTSTSKQMFPHLDLVHGRALFDRLHGAQRFHLCKTRFLLVDRVHEWKRHETTCTRLHACCIPTCA